MKTREELTTARNRFISGVILAGGEVKFTPDMVVVKGKGLPHNRQIFEIRSEPVGYSIEHYGYGLCRQRYDHTCITGAYTEVLTRLAIEIKYDPDQDDVMATIVRKYGS